MELEGKVSGRDEERSGDAVGEGAWARWPADNDSGFRRWGEVSLFFGGLRVDYCSGGPFYTIS